MFKYIIILIFIIYSLGALFTLLSIPLEKTYNKKLKKIKVKKYKNIYVLLPALKEQKIVSQTINHFRNVKYKGQIKFIIITTEKEKYEYDRLKIKCRTTKDIVEQELKVIEDNRFIHMHYEKINGNKSSQLNYAVEYIKNIEKDYSNVYVSVFDFDSKPDLNTFNDLNKVCVLRNSPTVIQQVPLCYKNFSELSKNYKNILILLYSLQHTTRSCAIEKMKMLICSLTKYNVPKYFMGACMHLRLDVLINNAMFPFVDDLTLGYRYSIKNLSTAYLPNDNSTLIYNDLLGYVNSATLIFKGLTTYISEIVNIKKHYFGKIKMFIAGTANLVIFAIIPFILIIYYAFSIINGSFDLLFFMMLSTHYMWSITSYMVFKTKRIKNYNKINVFLSIIISPIWQVFRPMGFILFIYKYVKSKIKKENIIYKKTER